MSNFQEDLRTGAEFIRNGRPERALVRFERAMRDHGFEPLVVCAWAGAMRALGRAVEVIQHLTIVLAKNPMEARLQFEMGLCLMAIGDYAAARVHFTCAIVLDPLLQAAHSELATALIFAVQYRSADHHFKRAIQIGPLDLRAQNNHCAALIGLQSYEAAKGLAEQILKRQSSSREGLANLAAALIGLGRLNEAIVPLVKCTRLYPDYPKAGQDLADIYLRLSRFDDAWQQLDGLEVRGITNPQIKLQRLGLLAQLGDIDTALDGYRQMIMDPAARELLPLVARAYLSSLPYSSVIGPGQIQADSATIAQIMPQPTGPIDFGFDYITPGPRRLRVAYLSGDLRRHSVARNLAPVLRHHDKSRIELILYNDTHTSDDMLAEFARIADQFIDVTRLDDDALARRIRADRIDILVIVAPRFDQNRLYLGRYRLAPLQFSFHDVATSGLSHMDYLIADPTLAPKHMSEQFAERVLRLPHFYIHAPMDGAPDPGPLPFMANSYLTFGSFNNPSKFNATTLALWGHVLSAVPDARLVLKYKDFYKSQRVRRRILAGLGAGDVRFDPKRVIFLAPEVETVADHLAQYRAIDLALDTTPFSGSTTSYESLCMGVPVITLRGSSMASRWTSAILAALGLEDFIAHDPNSFVALAQDWAIRRAQLAELRETLRARISASSISNGALRARQLERLYSATWQRLARKGHRGRQG
jgi:predicted O-linked N-acetylglucosamine transferase (SPINDLY family)